MLLKRNLVKAAVLSALALGSSVTWADFFAGTFFASRFNTVGTTTSVMRPASNHQCFLTTVGVTETDTGGERATCRVRQAGPVSSRVWILEAVMGTSSDADIQCAATCYTNF